MVCPLCKQDARFVEHRDKSFLTPCGRVIAERAYYLCSNCGKGHCPFDQANGLQRDHLSTGLRPLVCLAGVLESFRDGADDILQRFLGVRLCASTVRTATAKAGQRLMLKQRSGTIIRPEKLRTWDFRLKDSPKTVAYLGVDAFSVPMQRSGGKKAEGRMLYTVVMYTPDKKRSHYLVDFELDGVVKQLRQAAIAYGLGQAEQLVAITDGGNGLEAALKRHFHEDLPCILDWYHALDQVSDCADALYGKKDEQRQRWYREAEKVLWEQGGNGLKSWLAQQTAVTAEGQEGLRALGVYLENQGHRMDYPSYRARGWDIGSGPTEAACKVVGERLKGSGMRWLEEGAAAVAPLRALYLSGPEVWDAFWALAV